MTRERRDRSTGRPRHFTRITMTTRRQRQLHGHNLKPIDTVFANHRSESALETGKLACLPRITSWRSRLISRNPDPMNRCPLTVADPARFNPAITQQMPSETRLPKAPLNCQVDATTRPQDMAKMWRHAVKIANDSPSGDGL